jgi:PPM family protein phosphatase
VDNLMPIGEFSDRSGLSAKRLRTYAAEGLLVPAAVDPASGYRYYSPGQLSEARVIDALRQAGIPLAEIGAFVYQPSRETLESWSRQLQMDATHRRDALTLAGDLVAATRVSDFPHTAPKSKEALMNRLNTSGRTDIGLVRENNEDVIVTSDLLALVADGMGGHPGGEIAAQSAAGLVHAAFTGQSVDELEAAVRSANWAIRDRAATDPGLEGMGTTICAAGLLEDGRLGIVNVGDSRAYLWHEGALTQLTRDHSVTAELVQRGELAAQDAPGHPHHGVLTRALGVGPMVDIDTRILAVEEGDCVIICSDGLFNELSDPQMANLIAAAGDTGTVADNLIDQAIGRGARDNVSVVVAEVTV